jgi:hypothetical protein
VTSQRTKPAVREDAVAIDLSDTDIWIAAGTCVAAVAAVFSAWFSRRSSQDAAKTAQATLFLSLQRQYASDETLEDLRKLRSWREEQGADFVSKWKSNGKPTPRRVPQMSHGDGSRISLAQSLISIALVSFPNPSPAH